MSGCFSLIDFAARSPSSVWVGGIRMSTTATSGRCIATWRRRSSAVPDCATTSKPDSSSSRAIPSRSSTESSASTTRTGVAPGRARSGGKSPPKPGSSSWKIRSGSGRSGSDQRPRSRSSCSVASAAADGLREDDLASVPRRGDALGAVDVDADVAVLAERGGARVQADANAHRRRPRMPAEPALSLDCRRDGRFGRRRRRRRARRRVSPPRARRRRPPRRAAAGECPRARSATPVPAPRRGAWSPRRRRRGT